MKTIVDFRHGRIAAACARANPPGNDLPYSDVSPEAAPLEGAEIILFPRMMNRGTKSPRKRLSRRFALQALRASGKTGSD